MGNWEENVRKVVPYVPGEQPKMANLIKLNTNENPYPPSPRVMEAQLDMGKLKLYPDPAADMLVSAIADYHGVDKSRVFVGVGSDDVLAMCFLTFFAGKEPILFPDISYSFYEVWADVFRIPFQQLLQRDIGPGASLERCRDTFAAGDLDHLALIHAAAAGV